MTPDETTALAASGAAAGLCPLTEASLGDGIFDGARFLERGGRFGVGTDSQILIEAAAELRQLEYTQRLRDRTRNVLAAHEGDSVGLSLYRGALAGGAQALGRRIGAIAEGKRADIVVLDAAHPDLAGGQHTWLDAYVFVAGRALIRSVMVGGEVVVRDARHKAHEAITRRYREVVARVAA
jgi:cytosine/adenosine deaminase-related metal-dependent hydrolase